MSLLSLVLLVLSIVILLFISAFLSGSETAFLSLNRLRLRHLAKQKGPQANLVQKLIDNTDQLITTILISNNFVNITISSLSAAAFYYFLGPKMGIMVSTFVMTILILVFSEITPKIFAARHAEKYSFKVAKIMDVTIKLLSPISNVFTKFSHFIIKLFGGNPKRKSAVITEEEIKTIIEVGSEVGAVEDEEREMLHRVFEFNDIHVSKVMIPRTEIIAADVNTQVEDLLTLVNKEGYARIPIYEDEFDNIIGVLYVRDLLKVWEAKKKVVLRDLIRPAYFVSSDKIAMDLLKDFQRKRIQVAIVTDKQNIIVGLISLEDLLEEIVGEIEDWHD